MRMFTLLEIAQYNKTSDDLHRETVIEKSRVQQDKLATFNSRWTDAEDQILLELGPAKASRTLPNRGMNGCRNRYRRLKSGQERR